MSELWLLKGDYDAPGWKNLEKDSKAGDTEVTHFDRLAWALVLADEAPQQYEGLEPTVPPTGLYVDPSGVPVYIVDRREVSSPLEVIEALGDEARALLEKVNDPDTVLERLGRAY